jgi:Putative heavy-metal-binding
MKPHRLLESALVAIAIAGTAGCASYRVSSNIESTAPPASASAAEVLVSESGLPGRPFKELGPIEVSVKKLTLFHPNPTKEQANAALIEKARSIGADAVINVKYSSGIGAWTWGYLDAQGTGVKFVQ